MEWLVIPLKVDQIAQKRMVVECSNGSITSLEQGQLWVSIGSENLASLLAVPSTC